MQKQRESFDGEGEQRGVWTLWFFCGVTKKQRGGFRLRTPVGPAGVAEIRQTDHQLCPRSESVPKADSAKYRSNGPTLTGKQVRQGHTPKSCPHLVGPADKAQSTPGHRPYCETSHDTKMKLRLFPDGTISWSVQATHPEPPGGRRTIPHAWPRIARLPGITQAFPLGTAADQYQPKQSYGGAAYAVGSRWEAPTGLHNTSRYRVPEVS